MKDNPPPASDSALTSQFAAIGLTAENGFDPASLSPATLKGLERGYAAGREIVKMEAQKTGGIEANGWAYNLNAGKWGQDFNLRAAIALRVARAEHARGSDLHEHPPGRRQAAAQRCEKIHDHLQEGRIAAGRRLLVDHHVQCERLLRRKPDQSRRDRQPHRGSEDRARRLADDLSSRRTRPKPTRMSNWLPAPDGNFRLSMRLYVPKPEVLSGKWTPPAVTPQP